MTNIAALFSFLLVLILFVFGGLIVAEQLRSDELGAYSFLWRNTTDTTFVNESMEVNFTLQRISTLHNANFTLTFVGCNGSDLVRVGGYFVDNLSGASPKILTVNSDYLSVTTVVNYTMISPCNVTRAEMIYYSWQGCDYDIDTCEALAASFGMAGAVMYIPPIFIFLLVVLIVVSVIGGFMK